MTQEDQPTDQEVTADQQSKNVVLFNMGELVTLIAEHGVARVLIAAGLAIMIYVLFQTPGDDWQTNVALLGAASGVAIAGGLVRVAQMMNGVFSGRTMLLMCQKCRKPITSFGLEGFRERPPAAVRCSNTGCNAVNIFQ